MIFYLEGYVKERGSNYVISDVNGVGYRIYVSHPNFFNIDEKHKILTYQVIKELDQYLVGFISKEEKTLFELILSISGFGPISTLKILANCEVKEFIGAIKSNNLIYLENIPGISKKGAVQILVELRDKLGLPKDEDINKYDDVYQVLKTLKFKTKDINNVLSSINIPYASNEEILKEALRRLNKK